MNLIKSIITFSKKINNIDDLIKIAGIKKEELQNVEPLDEKNNSRDIDKKFKKQFVSYKRRECY